MANSSLPETGEFAVKLAWLCDADQCPQSRRIASRQLPLNLPAEQRARSGTGSAGALGSCRLFGLDPAEQVLSADCGQQGRMVGGQVPPDHPDHLVLAVAAGHEPALAPDQLRHRASPPSL